MNINIEDLLREISNLEKEAFTPFPGGSNPQAQQAQPAQGGQQQPGMQQSTLAAAGAIGGAPSIAPMQPEGGDPNGEMTGRLDNLEKMIKEVADKHDERLNPELDKRLHLIENALEILLNHTAPKDKAPAEPNAMGMAPDPTNTGAPDPALLDEYAPIGQPGPSGKIVSAEIGGFNKIEPLDKPTNIKSSNLSRVLKAIRNEN